MVERISVYGLGKLGSTMLACFAHSGFQVIGMDINKSFVEKINSGGSPIYEPGVDSLIAGNKGRISASTNPFQPALDTDASFIIVPTPSLPDGSFTTQYVLNAAVGIAEAIKNKDTYHLVVVTSTVMPGETEKVRKYIEAISGKKCNKDFGICYNPDFIALGRIVSDFLNPDMILIGQSDELAGDLLSGIHSRVVKSDPEIHRMSLWNAELSKIALNSYCTMKITFANILGEICEKVPGGDAFKVSNAVGADSRVGKKYFRPGLGYSGPCFPRDNRAFAKVASNLGVRSTLANTIDEINDYQKNGRVSDRVMSFLSKGDTVSVLGLTYKEDTTLVEESAALSTAVHLAVNGVRVKVYDPAGMQEAKKAIGPVKLEFCDSALECIKDTTLCFVATPWSEFKKLSEKDFKKAGVETVLDAWGLYGFEVKRIGKA